MSGLTCSRPQPEIQVTAVRFPGAPRLASVRMPRSVPACPASRATSARVIASSTGGPHDGTQEQRHKYPPTAPKCRPASAMSCALRWPMTGPGVRPEPRPGLRPGCPPNPSAVPLAVCPVLGVQPACVAVKRRSASTASCWSPIAALRTVTGICPVSAGPVASRLELADAATPAPSERRCGSS